MADTAHELETTEGAIHLTPAAIRKVRQLLEKRGNPSDLYLRLGVRGGGCSGYSYALQFDRDVDPEWDCCFEFEGVRVVVDRRSLRLLNGTTLDFTGELLGQGFEFRNPNIRRTCGCGVSFQV